MDPAALMQNAAALRAAQRMGEADAEIAKARGLAPDDRLIAFLHAQSRYELGYPAAELFADVAKIWPENRDVIRNHALALASEGNAEAAIDLLAQTLTVTPDWLDGQRVLAGMRWTQGDVDNFDAAYRIACKILPQNQALWLGWFSAIAQHRNWPRALEILDMAAQHCGDSQPIAVARAFVAAESGDPSADRQLAKCADVQDDFLALCRIRHALRCGNPAAAAKLALPLTQTKTAGQVWPYLSTAWRLLDDPRSQWLDGNPAYVVDIDPGFSAAELTELAVFLRQLHTAKAAYAEQSVRGGTQTDRSLLLRHEPILQQARGKLMAAMQEFAASLPPDQTYDGLIHPLLSRPRTHLCISGSWSVCLTAQGHNVAHSHPQGWLSSAFYVSLPDAAAMGEAPAGYLQLGAPPGELGLNLAPYQQIQPRTGHLVIFPSTIWHGTVPTHGGERLNIAFDVVPA
jgi:tetratricopeptide (TPR) repeat protein